MSAWNVVRFLAALGCFLLACLALTPVPTILLFQLKVVATEFGHWAGLIALLVLFAGRRNTNLDSCTLFLAAAAAALFFSSSLRASMFATRMKKDLIAAFPGEATEHTGAAAHSTSQLFSIFKLAPSEIREAGFAQRDGTELLMDFYPCQDRLPAPCVIVLHGGGWDSGSRKDFQQLNYYLARNGYAVAAIDYRLAPRWKWPAQGEDLRAALHFLAARAEDYGIDPKQFVLLGRSAGGQIAEAVAYGAKEPGIAGCIAFYAPADLHFAYQYADAKDILNSRKLLLQYLGGPPERQKSAYDSASGILHVQSSSPPTLLIHGRPDELVWVRQSERLAARLQQVGARHYFAAFPWATHSFDFNFNGPGGQLSTWAVKEFLDRVTAP